MKGSLRIVLPLLMLMSCIPLTFGQHTMFLTAPTTVTYLDDIINGDTTSTGARQDAQRVYVLQRGGTWFWHNTLINVGWKLDIEAADTGNGGKPYIYSTEATGTTAAPYDWVDVQGDVTIKNLNLCGYFDLDPTAFNTYGGTFILFRCATPGPRMEFVGNVFSNVGQAVASAFAAVPTIIFRDNVFANMGLPPTVDVGNGRAVDVRNVSIDSLVFQNNTYLYGFDRVVRHIASVGRLNHFIFDHNTVYQNGGRYGLMALGAVGASVQITNNIFIDPMAFGADTNSKRQSDFKEMKEFDANGKVKMTWIYNSPAASDTLPGVSATSWNISNNFWYVTPQIQTVWNTLVTNSWDPNMSMGRMLSDSIKSKIDTTKAFIKLDSFSFTNITDPMAGPVLWASEPTSQGGTGGASSGGTYIPYDKHLTSYYVDTLDCTYSTSSAAYTGASGGYPAGDLNWFPSKKTQWENNPDAVKIDKNKNVPTTFSLSNAYPNPFNPSTTIKFDISKAANVKLVVFNILGQKVATLVNGSMKAGSYNVVWDGKDGFGNSVASGIYLYRLESDSFNATKKMILMK